jgi:hypothetical protein
MIPMIDKNEKIVNTFCEKSINQFFPYLPCYYHQGSKDLREVREQVYAMVKQIQFQAVHYRTDIAMRALQV